MSILQFEPGFSRRLKILFVFSILLVLLASVSSSTPVSSQSSPFLTAGIPQTIQPLTFSDIRHNFHPQAKTQPVSLSLLHTFPSICTLSRDDVQVLSTTPPLHPDDESFIPFGEQLHFAYSANDLGAFHSTSQSSYHTLTDTSGFKLQSYDVQNQDPFLDDDLVHKLASFTLQLEKSVVLTDPTRASKLAQLSATDDVASNDYVKRTTYKGSRLTPDGFEETMILSVMPVSGYAKELRDGAANNNRVKVDLETQSDKPHFPLATPLATLSFGALSGRNPEGYTIDATIFTKDQTLQITSYSTLLFDNSHALFGRQVALHNVQNRLQHPAAFTLLEFEALTAEEMQIQADIDALGDFISTLYLQQTEAAYDLAILVAPKLSMSGCGADSEHSHSHDEEHDDFEAQKSKAQSILDDTFSTSPTQINPLWKLTAFGDSTTCHPRFGRTTVFPIRFYVAVSFQRWSSGVTTDAGISAAVATRIQYILTVLGFFTHAQMSFNWGLKGVVLYSPGSYGEINQSFNEDGITSHCYISKAYDALKLFRSRSTDPDLSPMDHALLYCNAFEGGTSGVNIIRALGKKSNAIGVSGLGYLASWTTIQHELGHGIGLNHPFSPNKSPQNLIGMYEKGKWGGFMDYGPATVPAYPEIPVSDQLRTGFNYLTDKFEACQGLALAFRKAGTEGFISSELLYVDATPTTTSCNHNSILDSFEECDAGADTTCCVGCKYPTNKPLADCDGSHPECCDVSTCQSKPGSTMCALSTDLDSIKRGYCSKGLCVPFNCPTQTAIPLAWGSCSATSLFSVARQAGCGYSCPSTTACPGQTLWNNWFLSGTRCSVGKVDGVCVTNSATNGYLQQCQTNLAGTYSWDHQVLKPCTATAHTIEVFICRDIAGTTVHSQFCAGIPKPMTPPRCDNHAGLSDLVVPSEAQISSRVTISFTFSGEQTAVVILFQLSETSDFRYIDTVLSPLQGANTVQISLPSQTSPAAYFSIKLDGATSVALTSAPFRLVRYLASDYVFYQCPDFVCQAFLIPPRFTCKVDPGGTVVDPNLCPSLPANFGTSCKTNSPCQNSGVCITSERTQHCSCPLGVFGEVCESVLTAITFPSTIDVGGTAQLQFSFAGTVSDVTIAYRPSASGPLTTITNITPTLGANDVSITFPSSISTASSTAQLVLTHAGFKYFSASFTVYSYTWSSSLTTACPSFVCSATNQINTVSCMRAPDNVVAGDLKCASVSQPPTTTPCNITVCQNSGMCADSGTTQYCHCIDGFTGSACDVSPPLNIIHGVQVDPTSLDAGSTPATVTWAYYGNIANTVNIFYQSSPETAAVILNTTPIDAILQTATVRIPFSSTRSTTATITVTAVNDPTNQSESSNLTISTYIWIPSEWSKECGGVVCGALIRTREVFCADSEQTNRYVHNAKCDPSTKPPSIDECPFVSSCSTHGYCNPSLYKCVCDDGYYGETCLEQMEIRLLDVNLSSQEVDAGDELTVNWVYSGPSSFHLQIYLQPSPTENPLVLHNSLISAHDRNATVTIPSNTPFTSTGSIILRMVEQLDGEEALVADAAVALTVWTYSYQVALDWGPCSAVLCGEGDQTREIYCVRSDNFIQSNWDKCSGDIPATSRSCSALTKCAEGKYCVEDTCICNNSSMGEFCDLPFGISNFSIPDSIVNTGKQFTVYWEFAGPELTAVRISYGDHILLTDLDARSGSANVTIDHSANIVDTVFDAYLTIQILSSVVPGPYPVAHSTPFSLMTFVWSVEIGPCSHQICGIGEYLRNFVACTRSDGLEVESDYCPPKVYTTGVLCTAPPDTCKNGGTCDNDGDSCICPLNYSNIDCSMFTPGGEVGNLSSASSLSSAPWIGIYLVVCLGMLAIM